MALKNLKIAVISGGDSAEADVSRSSAAGVIEALSINFKKVYSIELDQNLAKELSAFNPDVVFPILHGPPGEDGTLQGFLEIMGYTYVGSNVRSSALAMDKIIAKQVFFKANLPIANQCIVQRDTSLNDNINKIIKHLGESVVIKPTCQGSAIGVTLIEKSNALGEGLEKAFEYDHQLLIEERILGREITVGVIDTQDGVQPFPVIEITTPEDSWYDFDHRYTKGWSRHVMPADLPQQVTIELQEIAVAAHQSLGCRDLSRADFIVTDNDIYLLEVNSLPGMTPTSLYPDGARGYGLDFPELVMHLVKLAASRKK